MRIVLLFFILLSSSLVGYSQKKKAVTRQPLVVADSLFVSGNYKEAIPNYVSALKQSQAAAGAQPWFRLGFSYHRLKDYPMALDAYRRAEKINPQFPGLAVNISKVYSASGDVNSSATAIDSAMRKGFTNFKLLDTDPDFENLRKSTLYADLRSRLYLSAYPCENLPAARVFDFWLGEWDVFPTANPATKAGTNKISRKSSGCVILEEWESTGPHNGVSINYFDPVTGKWNQKWAGSGQDFVEFYDGVFSDNALRFKFDIPAAANATAPTGRLTFTALGSDKVRQHAEQSTDGGKTWVTQYDFTYVKRK